MHFNVINRKVHHWASFIVALPILVIVASGLLLQLKKQWDWVQPPEQRGSGTVPIVSFDHILSSLRGVEPLNVTGWDDVDRLDVRPGRGVVKITLKNGWEAQVDLTTGRLLQTAYRRSDLIESIHDGSFFAGDWTKLGIFLPAGLTLLLLWLTGVWMVWVQFIGKRRRKKLLRKRVAIVLFALGLGAMPLAEQGVLAVDTIGSHWATSHAQLPLNVWHDVRVEIRGTRIIASVNGRLRVEHTLPQAVSGRVGFWTKRDSVTAFKGFTATAAQ